MAVGRTLNPLVDQFRKGGVPKDIRMVAAQGTLPLGPLDLLELLVYLLVDRDEEVRQAAEQSLSAQPEAELLPIFKDKMTSPDILAWGLRSRTKHQLRAACLQNTSLNDAAIEELAPSLPTELAELVVINQVRLLRRVSLLEALETNTNLDNDQKRRLRELREEFIDERADRPPKPEPKPKPEPATEPEPEPATEQETVEFYLTEDEKREPHKLSAVQNILQMNTIQKLLTALKGTKEERGILIRDRNQLVATAALGNPRITEAEIEVFAGIKNISDEILRRIGASREWMRNYNVVSTLVRNPRTPLATSIGLVSRLNPRDLRGLVIDRNVSEALRKQARRFVRAHQEKQKKKKY